MINLKSDHDMINGTDLSIDITYRKDIWSQDKK